MVELSETDQQLIDALLKGPVAWRAPGELAAALRWGLEETQDVLADLDAGGWLDAWDREADLVVTLSVAAASALGVRLIEVGADEVPRWAGRNDPEPRPLRASGVFRGERAAGLERVVDRRASVECEAELFERCTAPDPPAAGRRPLIPTEILPRPTRLIGTGLVPWPGPGDGRKASCPACRSKRLDPSAYCLYCDRWGLDHLLRDEDPPRSRRVRDPQADARRAELERLGRKEKHKERLAARADADRPGRSGGPGRRSRVMNDPAGRRPS